MTVPLSFPSALLREDSGRHTRAETAFPSATYVKGSRYSAPEREGRSDEKCITLGPDGVLPKIPSQNQDVSMYAYAGTGFEGYATRLSLTLCGTRRGALAYPTERNWILTPKLHERKLTMPSGLVVLYNLKFTPVN